MRHFLQYSLPYVSKPWLLLFLAFLLIIFLSCKATKNHPQINYAQLKDLLVQGQVVELAMRQGQATAQLNEGAEITLSGQGPEQIRTDITVVNVRINKELNEDLIWTLRENNVKFHSMERSVELGLLLGVLPIWLTILFIGFIIFATFSIVVKRSPLQFDVDFGQLSPSHPKNRPTV